MTAHEELLAGPTIENRVQKAVFLWVTQTVCSSSTPWQLRLTTKISVFALPLSSNHDATQLYRATRLKVRQRQWRCMQTYDDRN